VVWTVLGSYIILKTIKKKKQRQFFSEHAFFVSAMILLVVAPLMSLAVFAFNHTLNLWGGTVQVVIAVLLFAAAYRSKKYRLNPTEKESSSSFREKSAHLIFVAEILIFSGYFFKTWNSNFEAIIPSFIASAALLVVIMIAGHIAIALLHSPLEELDDAIDERDKAVALSSTRNAYYVLAVGFWSVPILIIAPVTTAFALNCWFAIFILSDLVKYGSISLYYRLGES